MYDQTFDLTAYVQRLEPWGTPECQFCSAPMVEVRPGVMSCPMDLDLDSALRQRVALMTEHAMTTEVEK